MGREYPREGDERVGGGGLDWVRGHVDEAFAVGEIGLDGHWVPEELWGRQEEVFRAAGAIALDAGKPIIIHTRKRERRAFEIVRELGATRV